MNLYLAGLALITSYAMSFFIGFCICYGWMYVRTNKAEMSYLLTLAREDIVTMNVKFDRMFNVISSIESHSNFK